MRAEKIAARLEANRIPFIPELPEKIGIYLELLREWNGKMDLTAVEGEEDMLDRHFLDSLTVLRTDLLAGTRTLIDVGTGAGFPGMAIALAQPGIRVTLLDSQQKRLNFLRTVAEATGTGNTVLVHARAEDGARRPDLRERFDTACARAVAPLNVLSELLLPYVRVGGNMLCWKGPALEQEIGSGRKAAGLLGGKPGNMISCPLKGRDWDHRILPVLKIGTTPGKYPRKAGIPKKEPLGI